MSYREPSRHLLGRFRYSRAKFSDSRGLRTGFNRDETSTPLEGPWTPLQKPYSISHRAGPHTYLGKVHSGNRAHPRTPPTSLHVSNLPNPLPTDRYRSGNRNCSLYSGICALRTYKARITLGIREFVVDPTRRSTPGDAPRRRERSPRAALSPRVCYVFVVPHPPGPVLST